MAWSTVHFGIFQLQGWLGCCITGSDKATGRRPGAWDWVVGQAGRGWEGRGGGRGMKVGKAPGSQPGAPAKGSYPSRGFDSCQGC